MPPPPPAMATSYGIFPAQNNPNCVVHPSQIHAPVPAQYNLFGTIYDCSSGTDLSITGSGHINTRGWQCPVSITGAGVCSSLCVVGVIVTISSFGIAAGATVVTCFLCAGVAIWAIVEACIKNHHRSLDTIDAPLEERSTTPGYCSGSGLSTSALTILPKCLQPAMQNSCEDAALRTA
ncbi:MAG: hypothetical protein FRX48_05373 [Lasallia pustulata]|uniref:Uncharacterized protein n=1 Tax=Lasallia pustulata TaxID=136370 RepID=A0A5M8PQ54_9LECA|nr:MAG: hypothetical protein FRX48_05373 [Lasallia pustulata]